MALPATDDEDRLIVLIAGAEPRIQKALLDAVTAARGLVPLNVLADLLERGLFEEVLAEAARAGAIRLGDEVIATYVLSGQSTAAFLTDVLEVVVGFDQTNFRAVETMRSERLRLITNFTQEQVNATRTALVDGIQRGINPIEQARNFKASIGLTQGQQQAVQNFRRLLTEGSAEALQRELRDRRFDSTVRRAIRTGEPLTPAQVDKMVNRYSERQLIFRSETIARTEALRAVNAANEDAYLQAISDGLIDADQLERTWFTARDERVRGSHRRLQGLKRGVDETFPGAAGPLRFPGDPRAPGSETIRCRCSLSTRIASPPDEGIFLT